MRTWISSINFQDMLEKDRAVLATEYADGSASLKEVIQILWNHGIKVESCCKGYTDAELEKIDDLDAGNQPLICFNTRGLNELQVKSILADAIKLPELGYIAFGLYDYKGISNNSLTIALDKMKSTFANLVPALKKMFDPELTNADVNARYNSLNSKTQATFNRIVEGVDFELKDIDLSKLQDRYPSFPQSMYGFVLTVNRGGSVDIDYSLTNKIYTEVEPYTNRTKAFSDCCYTKFNGKTYIMDGDDKREIDQKEISEKKYVSFDEFETIRNLYLPKDVSTYDKYILGR